MTSFLAIYAQPLAIGYWLCEVAQCEGEVETRVSDA